MQPRQKLVLLVIGGWVAFVFALTILTHHLGVMGLLGLCPLLAFPFRKRRSPGPKATGLVDPSADQSMQP